MTAALRGLTRPRSLDGCGNCAGCSCRGARGLGSGEYIVIGTDERTRVHHTTRPPFRYICNLEYDGWTLGTGTLIGERTVLTAGHCVRYDDGTLMTPGNMRVVPGRNGPLEPLPTTRAVGFLSFPGYSALSPTDLALIYLANPIGRSVGWWRHKRVTSAADPVGTSISGTPLGTSRTLRVTVSGYPYDMPANPALHCRLSSGRPCEDSPIGPPRNRTRCGTEQWQSTDSTVSASVPGMLVYFNDTCPGHSGSPVWVLRRQGGGRVLVGVHVGRSPTWDSNRAVAMGPTVLRWLRKKTH
jgi:V8-like Glu-specific endopeptidase